MRQLATLLAGLGCLSSPPPAHAHRPPAPLPRLVTVHWHRKAELMTDRRWLQRRLPRVQVMDAKANTKKPYVLPPGSYLLATKVVRGIGQPGFRYYSLRDTAFMYSWGRYWPASTIKLMAAVGALCTLRAHGLDRRVVLSLEDADGRYVGPYWRLQRRALRRSTNVDYNRLVELAGFEALNEKILSARWGTPFSVIQRRYTHPSPEANLRTSPTIEYRQRRKTGSIGARHSHRTYARCPREGNCTSLFELQEVLRRVMLARELPSQQRYPINARDLKALQADLLAAPNKLEPGATQALGQPPLIYNKAGRVPGDDHNDNTFIVTADKKRYMIALSVPYSSPREKDEVTKRQLEQLGAATLLALPRLPNRGIWLQHDHGPPIDGIIKRLHSGELVLELASKGATALRFEVWLGQRRITHRLGVRSQKTLPPLAKGSHALVLIARRRGRRVGYRFYELQVP